MTIRHRTQYLLVNAVIVTASAIQLIRGLRPVVVIIAALIFLLVGNVTVYLAGSKQRAIDRQRKRNYYAGL
jgi:hypothetical protein